MGNYMTARLPICVFACLALTANAGAQDSTGSFFLRLTGGYALPAAAQNIDQFSSSVQTPSGSATYTQVNVSLGKGFALVMAVGCFFNKNMGAELGLGYRVSAPFIAESKYTYEYNGATYNSVNSHELRATFFSIAPAFVMQTSCGRLHPYLRMGLVMGSGTLYSSVTYTDDLFGEIIERWKLEDGLALGFNSSAGIRLHIAKNFSVLAELHGAALSWAPAKATLFESQLKGVDQLSQLTVREKNIVYEETYSQPATIDDNLPEHRLEQHYPFSSIGLNLGMFLSF